MSNVEIALAKDFSRFPGGRHRTDGPHSGQLFREEYLGPALRNGDNVTVVFDGVAGLPASFLEEGFGGLVRDGFHPTDLHSRLKITSQEPRLARYVEIAWSQIDAGLNGAERAV